MRAPSQHFNSRYGSSRRLTSTPAGLPRHKRQNTGSIYDNIPSASSRFWRCSVRSAARPTMLFRGDLILIVILQWWTNRPLRSPRQSVLAEATPDFAKDLYVANAAHSAEGDLVTIASTSDRNFKKYLSTKEPVDGYSIANIEWSERVGATKVTIIKDGNFATLTFNEALLSQRGPNRPSQPQPIPSSPLGAAMQPMPAYRSNQTGTGGNNSSSCARSDSARSG